MATTDTLEAAHTLRCQLAAESVDSNTGIIRGATVVKAGVQAAGKIVFLDASGNITRDEKLAKKRIPVFTDAKTLETLMVAAKEAGKRIKSREDHNDALGARLGFADTFRRVQDAAGDRVVADIHVFKTYKNRDILLETVGETPDEIGLSIDFTPTYEIVDGRALMRVVELHGVDVVDEGAVTPDGMFLSARVDTKKKSETNAQLSTEPAPTMPDAPSPNAEILAAITAMGNSICTALTSALTDSKGEAKPDDEALKAVKTEQEKLFKQQQDLTTQLGALRKERALLGYRGTEAEKAKLAAGGAEDIEKAVAGQKSYLQLVDEHAASAKCKKSEAHIYVQRNHSEAYRAHLTAKGVYDPAKANMKAA